MKKYFEEHNNQPAGDAPGRRINKKDLFLIICLASAAGIFSLIFSFQKAARTPDALSQGADGQAVTAVTARVDGELYGVWDLHTDREESIDTQYGHNHFCIRGGSVRMTEADCPDGLCIYQGSISEAGGLIVCLPHHLVLEIS